MEPPVVLRCERRHPRTPHVDEHGIVAAQVRPGHHADLLNVSASGVLIETTYRLLPGSRVELRMDRRRGPITIRGQVLRCSVSRLQPHVIYRGAIAFDRDLPWPDEREGYSVPDTDQRPGPGFRAGATQELI
ncbi:MAG TPA: PilZ domain-containing protein [Vicinamibacterales bacterium]|nr:PilZ domain-containing protein [Vicinamibacterales bacterium]